MNWSFTILRVRGIEIKVHATFGLILVWAAWYWGRTSDDALEGAVFGIVATLLLFAAVLLHELAHSFQAMRYGVQVRDITLYPIGGVARMNDIPEKPSQELGIAIVGPLTNLALAALLWGVGALLDWRAVISMQALYDSLGDTSRSGMLAYLTMANLALGLFNLIPAFPMDGGRVLRALLAMRMDYVHATRVAVVLGQGFALLLGFLGFATGNLSLILIAVFIWIVGAQEERQVELKGALRETTVGHAMVRQPQVLAPEDSLTEAADRLLGTSQTAFPIVARDDGRLLGLLAEDNLLQGLRTHGGKAPLREVRRTDVPTATAAEPLFRAMQRMTASGAKALVVTGGDGTMDGLLTTEDINEVYRLLMVSPTIVQHGGGGAGIQPSQPTVASEAGGSSHGAGTSRHARPTDG
jgi:Zn-dependent protease